MKPERKRLLIVDGYNVINAIRPVGGAEDLAHRRDELADRLMDYAGYTGQRVVLVFDAWMSDRLMRTSEERGPLTVVFTQKNETADHYIERLCDSCAQDVEYGRLEIRVATSDSVEQTVTFGRGAIRLSSRELLYEMNTVRSAAQEPKSKVHRGNSILDRLPEEIRRRLDEMRRGR